MHRILILAALMPAAAFAGPLDGVYDLSETACAQEMSDARAIIEEPDIYFHETSCTMANGVALDGFSSAWSYDLTCLAEGDTWTERAIFALILDGSRLVHLSDGLSTEMMRCP